MTTLDEYGTPPLYFPSAPIEGETLETVQVVTNDWSSDSEWKLFVETVEQEAWWNDGEIDPNRMRNRLSNRHGLVVNPRRLSAFYRRAVSIKLIEFSHWGINGDHKGRNAGKPARIYRLRKATT